MYKLKKILGTHNFSEQFIKTTSRYKKRLVITIDNKLHALWSTQSQSAKIVSEYDQEIPQSQTADYPVAPRGKATQPSRDTRKAN